MSRNEREEMMENGNKIGRSNAASNDSPNSIRRAGGEDPRRYDANIVMSTKVRDHDMSGYNHNGVKAPEAALGNNAHMEIMERRVGAMGSPKPDGTYSD